MQSTLRWFVVGRLVTRVEAQLRHPSLPDLTQQRGLWVVLVVVVGGRSAIVLHAAVNMAFQDRTGRPAV